MRTCELRRPVVTCCESEVICSLVSYLGRSEYRLSLLAPSLLESCCLRRVTEVLYVEYVCKTRLLVSDETVCDRTSVLECVVRHIRDRGTDVRLERPVVTESLVDVQEGVGVELAVSHRSDAVETVCRKLGELSECRSIELLCELCHRLVHTYTSCNAQPVENVVRERCVEHKAVLLVLAEVAVVDPVWILHCHTGVTDRPILCRESSCDIISLVHLHCIPVSATREDVGTDQRVVVCTLVDHIAVLLEDVACSDIEVHLVLEERCGVAESEVVSVVCVVRNDSLRIECRT